MCHFSCTSRRHTGTYATFMSPRSDIREYSRKCAVLQELCSICICITYYLTVTFCVRFSSLRPSDVRRVDPALGGFVVGFVALSDPVSPFVRLLTVATRLHRGAFHADPVSLFQIRCCNPAKEPVQAEPVMMWDNETLLHVRHRYRLLSPKQGVVWK